MVVQVCLLRYFVCYTVLLCVLITGMTEVSPMNLRFHPDLLVHHDELKMAYLYSIIIMKMDVQITAYLDHPGLYNPSSYLSLLPTQ